MALIIYQNIDTAATFNVGCSSRSAGLTTDGNLAVVVGVDGVLANTMDPDNQAGLRACYVIECPKPGATASWDSGDWVVRVNLTAGDAGTLLEEIHICDWLSGTGYTTVSTTGGTSLGLATNAGQQIVTLTQGSAHTPQSAADSQPVIVLVLENTDAHGASTADITPAGLLDSPIDDGVAGGSAHYYNKLLGYRAA